MARLRLSNHAKLQMRRRGVAVEDLRSALANSHTSYPGTNDSGDTVVKVGTTSGGRDLCVVVRLQDHTYVVTAFWKEEQ